MLLKNLNLLPLYNFKPAFGGCQPKKITFLKKIFLCFKGLTCLKRMISFFSVMSLQLKYRTKSLTIFPKLYQSNDPKRGYKPGNKDFCRSIPESSEYYKDVLSAFYVGEKALRRYGRTWSECLTQTEELHYCWIAIDLKLDRDRPLEVYAYTGKSSAIWGRLCQSTHGNLELDRNDKILIHATKSSDESHAALVSADEFNELDPKDKATVPQVEQSNINAIRAVRSIKLLNRKDEDANRIINPVLFKKMKQIERMAEQLNKKLLKLRQVWLNDKLVPTVSSEQIKNAFNDAVTEWYENYSYSLDVEQSFRIDLPALKDKIQLAPADAEGVENTKQILREIKGCEIFKNDSMGLKYCFKYLFSKHFDNGLEPSFVHKIKELESEISNEQAAKQQERQELKEKISCKQTTSEIFEAKKSRFPKIKNLKEKIKNLQIKYWEIKNKESKTVSDINEMDSLKYQYNHYKEKLHEVKMSLKEERDYWDTLTEDECLVENNGYPRISKADLKYYRRQALVSKNRRHSAKKVYNSF